MAENSPQLCGFPPHLPVACASALEKSRSPPSLSAPRRRTGAAVNQRALPNEQQRRRSRRALRTVLVRLAITELPPCENRGADLEVRHASLSDHGRHFDLAPRQSPQILRPLRVAYREPEPQQSDRIATRARCLVRLV